MKKIVLTSVATFLTTSLALAQAPKLFDPTTLKNPGQLVYISDMSYIDNTSKFSIENPQVADMKSLGFKRKDDPTKLERKGWNYFEIAYKVPQKAIDASTKREMPIFMIPEVEVTFALLYDAKYSEFYNNVEKNAAKAKGAINAPEAGKYQRYSLFTKTYTYQNITPGRDHYVAMVLPPAIEYLYGQPVIFSAEIKINGDRQGDIATRYVKSKSSPNTLDPTTIIAQKRDKGGYEWIDWWTSGLDASINRRDGLRDRSFSPFYVMGSSFYDVVKETK